MTVNAGDTYRTRMHPGPPIAEVLSVGVTGGRARLAYRTLADGNGHGSREINKAWVDLPLPAEWERLHECSEGCHGWHDVTRPARRYGP
jgi:hypothetical protein